MDKISPKYQMKIVQNINDKLYELFKSYDDVEAYIENGEKFMMTLEMRISTFSTKMRNARKLIQKDTSSSRWRNIIENGY